MEIVVRTATENDTAEMCRVQRAAIFGLARNHYAVDQKKDWVVGFDPEHLRMALAEPAVAAFVAENGGKMAGFSVMNGDELRALYVRPEASGKGVGSRLLGATQEEALARGIRRLRLYATLNSRSFYESNGFYAVKEGEYSISKTETMTCVEMEKDLLLDQK